MPSSLAIGMLELAGAVIMQAGRRRSCNSACSHSITRRKRALTPQH
jgi:hypothetical protein